MAVAQDVDCADAKYIADLTACAQGQTGRMLGASLHAKGRLLNDNLGKTLLIGQLSLKLQAWIWSTPGGAKPGGGKLPGGG